MTLNRQAIREHLEQARTQRKTISPLDHDAWTINRLLISYYQRTLDLDEIGEIDEYTLRTLPKEYVND
jgi:hypothetical protein